MKRTAALAGALTLVFTLTACNGEVSIGNGEPTAKATQSAEATPEPAGPTTDAAADEATAGAPVDQPGALDLAGASAATGPEATSGPVTLRVPGDFVVDPSIPAGEGQVFVGPVIPESVSPDGKSSADASIVVSPAYPAEGWDGTFTAHPQEGQTETFYSVEIPGVDAAGVRFVERTEGKMLEDETIGQVWHGATGYAEVYINAHDELTQVSITTSNGEPGLDVVRAILASVTVAG